MVCFFVSTYSPQSILRFWLVAFTCFLCLFAIKIMSVSFELEKKTIHFTILDLEATLHTTYYYPSYPHTRTNVLHDVFAKKVSPSTCHNLSGVPTGVVENYNLRIT